MNSQSKGNLSHDSSTNCALSRLSKFIVLSELTTTAGKEFPTRHA